MPQLQQRERDRLLQLNQKALERMAVDREVIFSIFFSTRPVNYKSESVLV